MENARAFGVDHRILGIKTGVPDTLLPCDYFDYAYTTTCLEYGYCEDASDWWSEHVSHDDPAADYTKAIHLLSGSGWLSFGYVIAVKE